MPRVPPSLPPNGQRQDNTSFPYPRSQPFTAEVVQLCAATQEGPSWDMSASSDDDGSNAESFPTHVSESWYGDSPATHVSDSWYGESLATQVSASFSTSTSPSATSSTQSSSSFSPARSYPAKPNNDPPRNTSTPPSVTSTSSRPSNSSTFSASSYSSSSSLDSFATRPTATTSETQSSSGSSSRSSTPGTSTGLTAPQIIALASAQYARLITPRPHRISDVQPGNLQLSREEQAASRDLLREAAERNRVLETGAKRGVRLRGRDRDEHESDFDDDDESDDDEFDGSVWEDDGWSNAKENEYRGQGTSFEGNGRIAVEDFDQLDQTYAAYSKLSKDDRYRARHAYPYLMQMFKETEGRGHWVIKDGLFAMTAKAGSFDPRFSHIVKLPDSLSLPPIPIDATGQLSTSPGEVTYSQRLELVFARMFALNKDFADLFWSAMRNSSYIDGFELYSRPGKDARKSKLIGIYALMFAQGSHIYVGKTEAGFKLRMYSHYAESSKSNRKLRLVKARSLPTAKARVVFPLSSRFPETTRPQDPRVVAVMETVLIVALNATRDCGLNVNLVDSRLLVRKVPFEEYSRLYQAIIGHLTINDEEKLPTLEQDPGYFKRFMPVYAFPNFWQLHPGYAGGIITGSKRHGHWKAAGMDVATRNRWQRNLNWGYRKQEGEGGRARKRGG